MSFNIRDGQIDVALIAGPGLGHFPTRGVSWLSQVLSEGGLRVGVFGGEDIRCKGVLPKPDAGAVLLLEDAQQRIHRIHVSALVRVAPPDEVPLPFPGSCDPRVLHFSSARRLQGEGVLHLEKKRLILLGGGNRTLSFGSQLLAQGCMVVAVSPQGFGEAWTVERNRFERRGGILSVGQPQSFRDENGKAEFTCLDPIGTRVFETDYIISVENNSTLPRLREYPKESLLFEFENRALLTREADVLGWNEEEVIAEGIAARILKVLRSQKIHRRGKESAARSSPAETHRTEFHYRGKWLESESLKRLRSFSGTPRSAHTRRLVASIECIDSIPCDACEVACPEKAIHLAARGTPDSVLREDLCTACGICVEVCPSEVPVLVEERGSQGKLVLKGDPHRLPAAGALVSLVNRRGDGMGTGRSLGPLNPGESDRPNTLHALELPAHLLFEVRGIKVGPTPELPPTPVLSSTRLEIMVDGHRRQVEAGHSVLATLRTMGRSSSTDVLYCQDGSCRRCFVTIDGVKQLGCQTQVRAGMAIEQKREAVAPNAPICPCLGLHGPDLESAFKSQGIRPLSVLVNSLRLGEGRCRGRLCMPILRRLAEARAHPEAAQWIDWRFPSEEWVLNPGAG